MVKLEALTEFPGQTLKAHRLVNSRFPPIDLFDDVADAAEFATLHEIQALTNPRLQNEIGRLELIALPEIPFGIVGCSYAVAPFTHVNPAGSRFSDGSIGVLYLADTVDTALAEVRYHQDRYWSNVPGLSYERFVFRSLVCHFSNQGCRDAAVRGLDDPIHDPDDYTAARRLGRDAHDHACPGLRYRSVRAPGSLCWALMTPRHVRSVIQSAHFEMIWSGRITSVNRISNA
ncbi:RES family NAD+ phosphorylase [Pseudomonas sp. DTU_2021_1001937_2_SI_NGA_ILE_001]|uniref:RES family NAD+ phosphorylase n=1 Tax=Pseudomonas sp. DTU_2021_1001937_2_SI_NGA_ILE_001 TaxID=3077589 RepID=UPI0028FC18FB|nr:RES family NAD+ phosphorylase [Pseudomonas sp. DTU_2021_1001937_2_SI_NGA_ILE_001]WNW10366.1 RES family NAD+ phosphorylase [Pseudomonas sp. DTU_2021_1001937_2_SI_NGA_ILE_001]